MYDIGTADISIKLTPNHSFSTYVCAL